MPVHDYDWGPRFNAQDGSGIASIAPPRIKRVLTMFAPKVDADGNERGGVPVVLLDAPLGTYLGWNVTADGDKPFHKDQICNYVGGMVPFARTAAERRVERRPAARRSKSATARTRVMSSRCAPPRRARWSRSSCCPKTRSR